MSKKKMARRALFTSMISLILCCAMLMGTTFAWFTDSVSSGINQINAGNLDVELLRDGEAIGAQDKLFLDCNGEEIARWEPGVVAYTNVQVANVGDLALKYQLYINATNENATTEDGYKLSEVLKIALVKGGVQGTTRETVLAEAEAANAVALSTFNEDGVLYPKGSQLPNATSESETYGLVVFWSPNNNDMDNRYNLNNTRKADGSYATTDGQALHIELGVILYATQLDAEVDSFGPDYDGNLNADTTYVSDAASFKAAMEKGGHVALMNPITLTADDMTSDESVESIPYGIYVSENTVLNLNGQKLAVEDTGDGTNALIFVKNANLTITGNGTVEQKGGDDYLLWAKGNSNVTIKSGNYIARGADSSVLYASSNEAYAPDSGYATITVEGGSYTSESTDPQDWANVMNHGAGRIVYKGGDFSWNPETVTADDKQYITVAEGYKVTAGANGRYYIAPETTNIVTNSDELKAAIENKAAEITMAPGDYSVRFTNNTAFNVDGMTIIGQDGVNLSVSSSEVWYGRIQGSNVTFENITFTGTVGATGEATYNNCTFEGQLECASSGGAKTYVNDCTVNTLHTSVDMNAGNVYVEESTITKAEYSGAVTMTFEDCTIGELIPWNTNTVLNNCTVTTLNAENMTTATLIIDGEYYAANADMLASAAKAGASVVNLADGEYDVYGCGGKTLTINGSEDAVLKLYNDGEDGCDYAFGGNGTGVGNITFNGVTIDTTGNTGNYKGYAYMKGTFNDCNFVGAYSLNNANDFAFNRCTFDFKNGYFWTWGANSVTFDGCTFNGNSKCILAHGYASTVITINNCEFAATEKGYTGAGDNTAAVEIDPAGTNTYTINFTGENTKTDSYAGWTRVKDGSTGHTITGLE